MTSSVRLEFMPMSMREYGQKSPAFDVVAIRPRMLPPSAISTGRAKFRMTMDSIWPPCAGLKFTLICGHYTGKWAWLPI